MEENYNKLRAQVLVDALPYIQKYNDKIVVVKYGGNAMTNEKLKQAVMSDIVLLSLVGVTAAAAPPEQTSENPDDEPAIVVPREKSTVMYATNVANTKTFEVKTPDVVIKVNPERTDLVETMEIDGRKCIVIQISDQVEVNGIPINNN